jgi:hypothetical protein
MVLDASGPGAATEVTTLGEMAKAVSEPDGRPGTIVIGAVVQLRGRLAGSGFAAAAEPAMNGRITVRSGS